MKQIIINAFATELVIAAQIIIVFIALELLHRAWK